MVTIGSQASGETGLKIWISGLIAPLTVCDRPEAMPSGTAMMRGDQEAEADGEQRGDDLVDIGRLAGVGCAT